MTLREVDLMEKYWKDSLEQNQELRFVLAAAKQCLLEHGELYITGEDEE